MRTICPGSAESCSQTCLTAAGARFLRWIGQNNKIARNLGFENKQRPEERPGFKTEEGPRGAKARKDPGPKFSKVREARRPEKKAQARNIRRPKRRGGPRPGARKPGMFHTRTDSHANHYQLPHSPHVQIALSPIHISHTQSPWCTV